MFDDIIAMLRSQQNLSFDSLRGSCRRKIGDDGSGG